MPSNVDGMRTKYRIAVMDVLNTVSGYVESNVVMKQLAPETPHVTAPTSGSTTYNMQPRFLITTSGAPDGRMQRIAVRIDNGAWVDSVSSPDLFSVNGALANGVSTIYQPAALSISAHTATIKCMNDSGSSAEVTRSFTVAQLAFVPIVQYVTIVTAAQMNTLHNAVNYIRAFYGQGNMRWVDPIVAGKTQVRDWPLHVLELRSGVEGVIYAVNAFDNVDTFDIPIPSWIAITGGYPRADVMNQLAQTIQLL
ncbi:hypothetical protein FACS1894184_03540 [Clostridia bacterium]|nr:hypothetical protein FACS1894184_03540 [Clostridia bacterium]